MNSAHSTLRIVSTWPPRACRDPETEWIFCPCLQGLPRRSNLWIASLPIHDANAILLDAIGSDAFRGVAPKPTYVGVCLVDPFRQLRQLFRTLMTAGISGVVNLPTTGAYGGSMARALDGLGTGVDREIAMLALAREQGLRIGGVATAPETASRMIDIGCDFVLDLRHGAKAANEIRSVICPAGRPEYIAAFGPENPTDLPAL
jgi:predicted TIM-barrel enzyme